MRVKRFLLLGALVSGGCYAAPDIPKGTSVQELTAKYGKPVAKGCSPQLGDKEEYLIFDDFKILTDQGKTIAGAEDSEIDFDIDKIRKRQSMVSMFNGNQYYTIDVVCF